MREYHCVEYAANGSGEKTVHRVEYSSVKALKWAVHMKRMFPEIAKCFKVEVHSYKPLENSEDQGDKE